MQKRTFAVLSLMIGTVFTLSVMLGENAFASAQIAQTQLPGRFILKYVDPLPTFVGARVPGNAALAVSMEEFQQRVLPNIYYIFQPPQFRAGTYVWGYKVNAAGPLYPAFTIEAVRGGLPTTVTYTNNLQGVGGVPPVLQKYITVDQTLHWADPLGLGHNMGVLCTPGVFDPALPPWCQPYVGPVPAVTHLHGAEVHSTSDGGPDAWFTPGMAQVGPAWAAGVSNIYSYPNTQEAATLWYHDHALGATRTNVYAGLAGFYFLRDTRDTGLAGNAINLPVGAQEVEVVIQDRSFDTRGQWFFPDLGVNPEHPFWVPEFVGDAIVVNGKTWPYMRVEQKRYRLRLLNGSNARFYTLQIGAGANLVPFWQIGTDGGLLDAPVMMNTLTIAPGERADVIVDFSGIRRGTRLIMTNTAPIPFPMGVAPDPMTTGQIMQFRVIRAAAVDTTCDPAVAGSCVLRTTPMVRLDPAAVTVKRQLTLNENLSPVTLLPLEVLENNTKWDGLMSPSIAALFPTDGISELPRVGDTELWQIINTTVDAHPIHMHLVQFQLVSRQAYDSVAYAAAYDGAFGTLGPLPAGCTPGVYCPGFGPPLVYTTPNADGALGGNPAITPYLLGAAVGPAPNENGWKDTVQMNPGEVSTVLVRWAPTDAPPTTAGVNLFTFDPTTGPGYVWHCHIIDHEDNEMMRPYKVTL
jgi:spore coat protein A, manganese oxidase